MSLSDRVQTDLVAQQQFLLEEFEDWRKRADPKGDLAQHHTQVRRVTRTLEGVLENALEGTALDGGAGAAGVALDQLGRLRRALGTVHLLWDFFRDKFAQRDTGFFSNHLGAADDLAWSCYLPFLETTVADVEARAAAAGVELTLKPEQLKEPPLLFYSSDRSPFAQARASAFQPPGLSPKDVETFRKALLHLPVPIIGFPWPQARRVPALVFVGHEVGHVVAEDLGLAGELEGLIAGLGLAGERPMAWQSWADEAFADVFGVLATGSAYVERLARILAADVGDVRNEKIDPQKPGPYPSRSVRMTLCHRVQELLGLPIEPTWRQTYGNPTGDSFDYAKDAGSVADKLLKGPYEALGDRGLDQVLAWKTADDEAVKTVASELLAGADPPVPFAVRTWVAASVRAQADDPQTYAADHLDAGFAERIVKARAKGVRSEAGESLRQRVFELDAGGLESFQPSLSQLDRDAGAELATMLDL